MNQGHQNTEPTPDRHFFVERHDLGGGWQGIIERVEEAENEYWLALVKHFDAHGRYERGIGIHYPTLADARESFPELLDQAQHHPQRDILFQWSIAIEEDEG